jgi:hypothetical protein
MTAQRHQSGIAAANAMPKHIQARVEISMNHLPFGGNSHV